MDAARQPTGLAVLSGTREGMRAGMGLKNTRLEQFWRVSWTLDPPVCNITNRGGSDPLAVCNTRWGGVHDPPAVCIAFWGGYHTCP